MVTAQPPTVPASPSAAELDAQLRANNDALAASPNDARLLAQRVRLMQAAGRTAGMADVADRLLALIPESDQRQQARLFTAEAYFRTQQFQRANAALTHYLNRKDEAGVRVFRATVRAAWGDYDGELADLDTLLADEAWVARNADVVQMIRARRPRVIEELLPQRTGPVYPLVLALRAAPEDEARRDAVAAAVIDLWNNPDHPLHTTLVGQRKVHALFPERTLEELDAPPKSVLQQRMDATLGIGDARPFRRAKEAMEITLPEAQAAARDKADAYDKRDRRSLEVFLIRNPNIRFKLAREVSVAQSAIFPLSRSYYRWGRETLWDALRQRVEPTDAVYTTAKRRLAIAAALDAADAYETPGSPLQRRAETLPSRAREAYWLSAFIDRWSVGSPGVFEAEAVFAWASAFDHENSFRLEEDLVAARLRALAAQRAGLDLPLGEINLITELYDVHRKAVYQSRQIREGLIAMRGVLEKRPPDFETAEHYLEMLRSLAPEGLAELDVAAAELAGAKGDSATRDRLLDEALSKKPDLARALELRADLLHGAGQKHDALHHLWAAAPVPYSRSDLYPAVDGRIDAIHQRAIRLERSLGLDRDGKHYLSTFNRLVQERDRANAALLYGLGIRLYTKRWIKQDDTALNNLLVFAEQLGSQRAGTTLINRVIPKDKKQYQARAHRLVAVSLLRSRLDVDDPERDRLPRSYFKRATEFDPDFVPGFSGLAYVAERMGRPNEATVAVNRAIELGSKHYVDFLIRARLLANAERPVEARRDLDEARRLYAENYPGQDEPHAITRVGRAIDRLEAKLKDQPASEP